MKKISTILLLTSLLQPVHSLSAATQKALPFGVGEEIELQMGWKSATAGTAVLKVVEIVPRKNRKAFKLSVVASTNQIIDSIFEVRDRFESWMDTEWLCSLGFSKQISEGDTLTNDLYFIDPTSGHFRRRKIRISKGKTPQESTGAFPPRTQDMVSAAYFLRTHQLKVGQSVTMNAASSDEFSEIKFNVVREEKVEVPAGRYSCVVIEPLFKVENKFVPNPKASITIWVSNDEKHIPVKILVTPTFGEVTAELIRYAPGKK
jgi:Protein of unknown function (DUF3108)